MRRGWLVSIAWLAVATTARADDDGLRCNGSIVARGMSFGQVAQLCGAPLAGYESSEERTEVDRGGREVTRYASLRAAIFDPGSGSFLRSVLFRNEHVESITTLDVRSGDAINATCPPRPAQVHAGQPAELVSLLCGEPTSRHIVTDELIPDGPRGRGRGARQNKHMLTTELWRYDGSSGSLTITVKGGVVVATRGG